MIIHTTASLRVARHRVERRMEKAARVLFEMKRGCALHVSFTRSGPQWTLTNGHRVDDDIARLVVQSASVIPVGDALFDDATSQTWRWWSDAP